MQLSDLPFFRIGWRSWNFFRQNISQAAILAQVDALTFRPHKDKPSLFEVGYSHIGIDDGWQACGTGVNGSFHDKNGEPLINLTRFPDMKRMNIEAHSKGVKMGWYANNCGCSEAKQFGHIGGHVKQDAQTAAELLFDGIKVDGCGPSQNITEWVVELNNTGRKILLEDCLTKRYTRQGQVPPIPLKEVFEECPGNFFRLASDIGPQFYSTMYNLIRTYNIMSPYNLPGRPASRPGCWTYSDMLEVGNGLDLIESRTHFAAFAITSSPLVLGFDLTNRTLYDKLYPIIANQRIISINQQWAGSAGTLAVNSSNYFNASTVHGANGKVRPGAKAFVTYPQWQIWRKPLVSPSNSLAILAINLYEKPLDIRVTYAAISMNSTGRISAKDAWTGSKSTVIIEKDGLYFPNVGSHDSVFLILSSAINNV